MTDGNLSSLDLIQRLVGFDTTSSRSNLALIDFVADYLDGWGIPVERIHSPDEDKANLLAVIGPADAPGVVVSGHTDVVPADPAQWTTPPFSPEIRDGRLYGRGSADMKSFIGIALAKLAPLHAGGLRHPVVLALSFDEEVGCRGAPLMVPRLTERVPGIRGCIIGEPTNMRVAMGHKGKLGMRGEVRGREGHSAYPERGVNAIDFVAELIAWVRHRAGTQRDSGPFDERFDPPYTTLQTGLVSGGTALNIVPDRADFDFEVRPLPGDRPEAHVEALRRYFDGALPADLAARLEDARLDLQRLQSYPGLLEESAAYIDWARSLASDGEPPITIAFGSEAGLFSETGAPAVVCGPGSIHQAHRPDEYIELDQIARGEAFFDRLADALRSGLPGLAAERSTS